MLTRIAAGVREFGLASRSATDEGRIDLEHPRAFDAESLTEGARLDTSHLVNAAKVGDRVLVVPPLHEDTRS